MDQELEAGANFSPRLITAETWVTVLNSIYCYDRFPRCRWENGLIRDPPLYPSFGPQNITVIMSQKSHHRHAFLIRFPETTFSLIFKIKQNLSMMYAYFFYF